MLKFELALNHLVKICFRILFDEFIQLAKVDTIS